MPSSSWHSWMRGSKPSTVGTTGSEKYRVSGVSIVGPMKLVKRSSDSVDVGTAAAEAADVALDLDGVLGVAGLRQRRGSMRPR